MNSSFHTQGDRPKASTMLCASCPPSVLLAFVGWLILLSRERHHQFTESGLVVCLRQASDRDIVLHQRGSLVLSAFEHSAKWKFTEHGVETDKNFFAIAMASIPNREEH